MNLPKIQQHIVDWLIQYIKQTQAKGFVVGISGGIDSALTSMLCAHTGYATRMVAMPIDQSSAELRVAKQHMDELSSRFKNCTSMVINLTPTYMQFDDLIKKRYPKYDDKLISEKRNLTLGNTRARLRMTTLYAVAGIEELLVAGTGNKVEDFGIGFFTKYGDGGVDISPIADLYKTQVYALAEFMRINSDILSASPTDGLWEDGRTDEDQIGATYAELENAMTLQQQYGNQIPENAFTSEREKYVWVLYIKRWKANQHKMNPIPRCLIPPELMDN